MKRIISVFISILFVCLPLFPCLCADAATTKIITVGDSITAGSCSGESIGSVNPNRTYQAYLKEYLPAGYTIENHGFSGLSVLPDPYYAKNGALFHSSVKNALASKPDIVLIMLGTNDSKLTASGKIGVWDAETGGRQNFYIMFKELVHAFQSLPTRPDVCIMLPPPVLSEGFQGRSAYRITNSVLENQIIPLEKQIANELGVPIIDINGAFPSVAQKFTQNQLATYLMDCVHPNYKGYQLIAKTVADYLGFENNESAPTEQAPQATQPTAPTTPSDPTPTTPSAQAPEPDSRPTFQVSYDANGASGTVPTDESSYHVGDEVTLADGKTLKREHYLFCGWSVDPDSPMAEYSAEDTVTMTDADLVLYAVWEKEKTYSVAFLTDPVGILAIDNVDNLRPNDTFELPVETDLDYDRKVWNFEGWAITEKDGALQKITEESLIISETDLTLVALFSEVQPVPQENEDADVPTNEAHGGESNPTAKLPGVINLPLYVVCGLFVLFILLLVLFLCKRKQDTTNSDTEKLDVDE